MLEMYTANYFSLTLVYILFLISARGQNLCLLSSQHFKFTVYSHYLIAALLLRLTVTSQCQASETWFVTGITNSCAHAWVVFLQWEEQKTSLSSAVYRTSEARLKLFPFVYCCTSLLCWLYVNIICTFLRNTILPSIFLNKYCLCCPSYRCFQFSLIVYERI